MLIYLLFPLWQILVTFSFGVKCRALYLSVVNRYMYVTLCKFYSEHYTYTSRSVYWRSRLTTHASLCSLKPCYYQQRAFELRKILHIDHKCSNQYLVDSIVPFVIFSCYIAVRSKYLPNTILLSPKQKILKTFRAIFLP